MAPAMQSVALLLAIATSGVLATTNRTPIKPSLEATQENANQIFNAIHSAGRQWGSSLYHNGFGVVPAIMPKGTLTYHGTRKNETPSGVEWLAFELEHAANFARSFDRHRPPGPPGPPRGDPRPPPKGGPEPPGPPRPSAFGSQSLLADDEEPRQDLRRRHKRDVRSADDEPDYPDPPSSGNVRGYLHTYQATRDLNLLLIDGMSAGKTDMGTLDSQDLLLRESKASHPTGAFDEWPRARELCDIAKEWGYDGIVRAEIGFEVIYCDFHNGLELASMVRTKMPNQMIGDDDLGNYAWVRAVAERYDGVGSDRLRIDWSSMVSGLYFPINISSTDADRPDLKRLAAASLDDLKDVKNYLQEVATAPRRFTVSWQGIVDIIVSRFGKRLSSMASPSLSQAYFITEVESLASTWYNAPSLPDDESPETESATNRTADAIESCRKHYLRPATLVRDTWHAEDELIYTAVDSVVGDVCDMIYSVRDMLAKASEDGPGLASAIEQGREAILRLIDNLGWTEWKRKQPCAADEVLFIAMWPFGDEKDHWKPGCRSMDKIKGTRSGYWSVGRP